VTLEGFLTQTAWSIERNIFGSNYLDPYAYDDSTGQGIYMQFLVGGVEQQAESFEDFARADMMGRSTSKYRKVAWIVKNWR
jgi:hypothetical protein